MFFGSHVLRMKAEHYTSSLQPSWLFPVDEYLLTLWQRAQKQLRTQSSLLFNGGALPSTYEPLLCSSCACICMSFSSCRYRALIFLFVFLFFIYIYTSVFIYIYISLYICILYMPISVNYFLYLSGTFLAQVLRPNSFHRCSNFTSHCRSFTSLPQKRFRKHMHAFYFPACFQV